MNSNQLVKASDCSSSQETNRNPACLIKARRNSWGKKKLLSKSLNTQIFVIFWGKKKTLNNPKSQCITNWNLPNHFTKAKHWSQFDNKKNLSQLAKNFSITKLFLFYELQKYTHTWKFLCMPARAHWPNCGSTYPLPGWYKPFVPRRAHRK